MVKNSLDKITDSCATNKESFIAGYEKLGPIVLQKKDDVLEKDDMTVFGEIR